MQSLFFRVIRIKAKRNKEALLAGWYSRRENLIFRNVPERPRENCREMIFDIMTREMDIEKSQMRCHAVHRIGKSIHGRPRPIIVRFVCREDKEVVFRKRNLLKESTHFPNVYRSNFGLPERNSRRESRSHQIEAQASGTQAKVIGRTLKIGSSSHTSKNVPKELLE